ncbi:MAG: LssY C-terminal domain-containing protein [Chloroflexota bacterium]|nr:LssY C-terminal domain-containing protein [Chloroflexota bacterium]
MAFACALLFALLLLMLLAFSVAVLLERPLLIAVSIAGSAAEGARKNEYVARAIDGHPRLAAWLAERLSWERPTGFALTLSVTVCTLLLAAFVSITQQVLLKELLDVVDHRVVALLPGLRTDGETQFFRRVTFLANWQSVTLVTLLLSAYLALKRQYRRATVSSAIVVLAAISLAALKLGIGRTRPEQVLSLIPEDSFSFPSGHALLATVVYGLVAYLLVKAWTAPLAQFATIIGYLVLVLLVALSRIYLGVHYPSDVLASLVFGGFLLSLGLTVFEMDERYGLFPDRRDPYGGELLLIPLIAALLAALAAPRFVSLRSIPATPRSSRVAPFDADVVQQLPVFSESITGATIEPIGLVYAATASQLEALFTRRGWTRADLFNLPNVLRAMSTGLRNDTYRTGPVTPSYIQGKPEDLAFEAGTASGGFRQRHHTRLWQTNVVTPDGRPIWVATASLDVGIEFTPVLYLPTHRIDPNIDAERDYIVMSLSSPNARYVQRLTPQLGKNAASDPFFTDGRVVLLDLSAA